MTKGINVEFERVLEASRYLEDVCPLTPIFPLDVVHREGIRLNIYGKFENVGTLNTFKARGAEWFTNCLLDSLGDSQVPKLLTASAGNHAQGVCAAAKRHSLEAIIYMPETASSVKKDRVRSLGGKLQILNGSFEDCVRKAKELAKQNLGEFVYVPPYENRWIIEGQATVMHDILRKTCLSHDRYWEFGNSFSPATPDIVLCGLGGGGLVSGAGAVCEKYREISGHKIHVIGVQTESADAMYRSIRRNRVLKSSNRKHTLAEGIGVRETSRRMLDTVRRYVDQVILVKEEDIGHAVVALHRHNGLKPRFISTGNAIENPAYSAALNTVEGAGAATYAAAVFGDKLGEIDWQKIAGKRDALNVYCVFSGGNITQEKIQELAKKDTPQGLTS